MSEKREPCEHNDYCERSPEFTEPRGYCCPAGATREAGGDCTVPPSDGGATCETCETLPLCPGPEPNGMCEAHKPVPTSDGWGEQSPMSILLDRAEQLEAENAELRARVERMTPVYEAAVAAYEVAFGDDHGEVGMVYSADPQNEMRRTLDACHSWREQCEQLQDRAEELERGPCDHFMPDDGPPDMPVTGECDAPSRITKLLATNAALRTERDELKARVGELEGELAELNDTHDALCKAFNRITGEES